MKTVIYIAVIFAVIALVDAKRGGPRGENRGDNHSGEHGDRHHEDRENSTSWTREVDGLNVSQRAFTEQENNASGVIITTRVRGDPRNATIASAVVIYEFISPNNTVSALKFFKGRRSACYLVPATAGLTFDGVVQELNDRNGTVVTAPLLDVKRNGTGEPLTKEEVASLIQQIPSLRKCNGAQIFRTTAADLATFPAAGAEEGGQKVLVTITLDTKISVLTNVGPRPQPPTEQPGGRPRPGRPNRHN